MEAVNESSLAELIERNMEDIINDVHRQSEEDERYQEEMDAIHLIMLRHPALAKLDQGELADLDEGDVQSFMKRQIHWDKATDALLRLMYFKGLKDSILLMVKINALK